MQARGFWLFRNFWDLSVVAGVVPGWEGNYFELRTDGRALRYPSNYSLEASGSTDSRKKAFVNFGLVYAVAPEFSNTYRGVSLGIRYRFGDRFSLDLQTSSHFEDNQLGYAFMRETNGEPIVGFRKNRDFIMWTTAAI